MTLSRFKMFFRLQITQSGLYILIMTLGCEGLSCSAKGNIGSSGTVPELGAGRLQEHPGHSGGPALLTASHGPPV